MSALPSTILPTTSAANAQPATVTNPSLNLSPTDFIQMMVTQLENQDPLNPTSDTDLLSQMSQIGQLQSSSDLQTSIQTMVLQNQVGSASSLIGKQVSGTDANANPISGTVSSVQVSNSAVSLQLDNGGTLPMSQVSTISAPAAVSTTGTPGGTTTGTTN